MRKEAKRLRLEGDRWWDHGDKTRSSQYHASAVELDTKIAELERQQEKETAVNEQPKQCPGQARAAIWVASQLERRKAKFLEKGVVPFFCFELYATNCDRHADEGVPQASHIDLATSALSDLTPEALTHVIRATEAVLAALKKRLE